jgi:hypothetical protein
MTAAEWEASNDPDVLLQQLAKMFRTSDRKVWLCAIGCWGFRLRPQIIEAINQYADGQISIDQVMRSYARIVESATINGGNHFEVFDYLQECSRQCNAFAALSRVIGLGRIITATMCNNLRCVFGNPFAPQRLDREWLNWNDGAIPKMARMISEQDDWSDMPVLADALEDAGCRNERILVHCRERFQVGGVYQPFSIFHLRGCWVIDLLLERE